MRQNYQISEQFPSPKEEEALGFPLFARQAYWLLHLPSENIVPIVVRDQDRKIIAFWCFYYDEKIMKTPFRAPFFTPYLSGPNLKMKVFLEVIAYVKKQFKVPVQFTLALEIKLSQIEQTYSSFEIQNVELGSRLAVNSNDFVQQIRKERKRRKLKSLLKDTVYKVSAVKPHEWADVYERQLIWRKDKGHENFMSSNEMTNAKEHFTHSYQAFQVRKEGELVGVVFFLMVDRNLVYVYSLITSPNSGTEEPSLLLWNELYQYAQHCAISIIDMGTSMFPEGGINKELARYKEFIGGSHYRKYTFKC